MMTQKVPKSFFTKVLKKVCSQKNYRNSGFAALCFKLIFCVFLKKKVDALLKNGHFQNVQFWDI
tara:strand:- start:717 stop:908 length:192 start_codon:yes stop_codon:yes gene_type:complete